MNRKNLDDNIQFILERKEKSQSLPFMKLVFDDLYDNYVPKTEVNLDVRCTSGSKQVIPMCVPCHVSSLLQHAQVKEQFKDRKPPTKVFGVGGKSLRWLTADIVHDQLIVM